MQPNCTDSADSADGSSCSAHVVTSVFLLFRLCQARSAGLRRDSIPVGVPIRAAPQRFTSCAGTNYEDGTTKVPSSERSDGVFPTLAAVVCPQADPCWKRAHFTDSLATQCSGGLLRGQPRTRASDRSLVHLLQAADLCTTDGGNLYVSAATGWSRNGPWRKRQHGAGIAEAAARTLPWLFNELESKGG
jgi:hypothetical protein